ncbi:hypothetical protein F2Q68_00024744 [Brassica cretica]|uniref:Uncharacterized protein n=1 Tax=Brassica cretica TaxID=69181 RepID=A0A8S9I9L6_BRACR|nr:hypothetical protein F2Q68_00024744 [Brassica cretica]
MLATVITRVTLCVKKRAREGRQGSISIRASYRNKDGQERPNGASHGSQRNKRGARKGRSHIVKLLLDNNITDTKAVNRTGETALDTAEKVGNPEVALILQKHGVPSAKTIKPSGATNPARSNTIYPDFSHRFEEQEGCVLVTESSSVDSTSNVKAPVKREGSLIERIEPAFYQSSANNHGPSVTIKKAKTEKSG